MDILYTNFLNAWADYEKTWYTKSLKTRRKILLGVKNHLTKRWEKFQFKEQYNGTVKKEVKGKKVKGSKKDSK